MENILSAILNELENYGDNEVLTVQELKKIIVAAQKRVIQDEIDMEDYMNQPSVYSGEVD